MNRDLKNEYPEMTGNFHSCVTETLDNLTAADDNKKIRRPRGICGTFYVLIADFSTFTLRNRLLCFRG